MSDEPADLTALKQRLCEARPHLGHLQRDALLFAAGRASASRGRAWPTLAGTLALLSIGLSATLLLRPASVVEVDRVVYVPALPPPQQLTDVPESIPSAQYSPALVATSLAPEWVEGLRRREKALSGEESTVPATVWATLPSRPKTDDIPDLSALRLNATPAPGDQFR